MDLEECYKILDVKETDSMDDIHSVYLKLCKKYHPDLYFLDMQKMWAAERFIFIDTAYKTILKSRIDGEEEKKLAIEIANAIISKLDKKTAYSDKSLNSLNIYLIGALVELIFMGVAVVLIATAFKGGKDLALVLIAILFIGFFYIWKAMRS